MQPKTATQLSKLSLVARSLESSLHSLVSSIIVSTHRSGHSLVHTSLALVLFLTLSSRDFLMSIYIYICMRRSPMIRLSLAGLPCVSLDSLCVYTCASFRANGACTFSNEIFVYITDAQLLHLCDTRVVVLFCCFV